MRTRNAATTVVVLMTALMAVLIAAQTGAAAVIGAGMSQTPPTFTPWVRDGEVDALLQVGGRMVAGGTFSQVSVRQSDTMLARAGLVIFDAGTGDISSVAPAFDGVVDALAPGPSATTVYVGGTFNNVNGVAHKSIVLLDVTTGQVSTSWVSPHLNGIVNDIQTVSGHLVIGGTFTMVGNNARAGLASLNPSTGTFDAWMDVPLTGHHNYNGTSGASAGVGAENMALTPNGANLVVIGNFKQAGGLTRDQVALIDVSSTPAVRTDWATSSYSSTCNSGAFDSWVRDVQVSPDGSYFAVAATGGPYSGTLCDGVSRMSLTATGTAITPTWVDSTGGDTLLSVAITDRSVFVGGHERWLNNPGGHDSAAAGSVPRPGLAALDPRTGVPQAWNPGRNPRGFGTTAMLLTGAGLWIGSDTEWIGNTNYHRDRLAFFPTTSDAATDTPAGLGSNIYEAGPTASGGDPDGLSRGQLTASGVQSLTAVTGSSVAWGSVRGGFFVGGLLYYAATDGLLHSRTFDGRTFGADTVVDPSNDPAWASVQTGSGQTYKGVRSSLYGTEASGIKAMGYRDGQLYYTVGTDTRLYSRGFAVDSGVSAPARVSTSTTLPAGVTSLFFAADSIYYVTSNGVLNRATWSDGAIVAGTRTSVSGPAIDGINWLARAVFVAT